ncbi:hypothetical protein BDW22DRAFT_1428963 [Trametopsis cervina]|nr:hypothetical protein BDW22DRAFT_1428963 [Trametopsis cervina]
MQILPGDSNVEGGLSPTSSHSSPDSLHINLDGHLHTGGVWLPPPGFREGYSPLYTSPLPQFHEFPTSAGYFGGGAFGYFGGGLAGYSGGLRIAGQETGIGYGQYDEYVLDEPLRPPTSPQVYAVKPHDDQSTAVSVTYQYSQCTGRKKALIIGIDYLNRIKSLKGAIADAYRMKDFLLKYFRYEEDEICLMTDEDIPHKKKPTRENIIKAMHKLVEDARADDSLFFHFAGHGYQIKDQDQDENDGLDETIRPMDWPHEKCITDDEMHDIMVKPLPRGCRLTAIFDSCHSGSALDLPFPYTSTGEIEHYTMMSGMKSVMRALNSGDPEVRTFAGLSRIGRSLKSLVTLDQHTREEEVKSKFSEADVISWSACKDWELDEEIRLEEGIGYGGAMSHAFINALKTRPIQSYKELLSNIQAEIHGHNLTQKPQLSTSHPMDLSVAFIC